MTLLRGLRYSLLNHPTTTGGPATHFSVTSGTPTAGVAINFTVTALTAGNSIDTAYAGTVAITSSDGSGTMPSNATLTSGVGLFSVTLKTAGTQTVTATDTVTASIVGSATPNVSPAAIASILTTAAASTTAGVAINVTVTALDAFSNTATGYTGTVTFTSTDGAATLPSNGTLTSGTRVFTTAVLKTAGTKTITATDTVTGTLTDATSNITVSPAAISTLLTVASSPQVAGTSFSVTVTAFDAFGNTATGYAGTVAFTSTDSNKTLPANGTLTSGTRTFTGVVLKTAGTQTVTATDVTTPAIFDATSNITVNPAVISTLLTTAPGTATSGVAITITVTAFDAYSNTATGYTGTVTFTSTDGSATLPSDGTLTSGTRTFSVTLKTAGTRTVTATDTTTPAITDASGNIVVSGGSTTLFQDTFTGTNGDTLHAHTPDIDLGMGGYTGGNDSAFEIQGNKLQVTGALGEERTGNDTGESDVTISLDIIDVDSSWINGIMFRYVDDDNYWYCYNNGSQLVVGKRVSGTSTDRSPISGFSGDHTLTVTLSGNSIIATDGTGTDNFSDSFNNTATIHGVRTLGNNSSLMDNLLITTP